MTANLQSGFRKWQQKRVNETIEVKSLTKKQRTGDKKGSSFKFASIPLLMSIPLFLLIPKAYDVVSILFHGLENMTTISSDDSTPSVQTPPTAHVDVPSWEKLDVLLEQFPTFTNIESPMSHMNELFPILERIPIDMIVDP